MRARRIGMTADEPSYAAVVAAPFGKVGVRTHGEAVTGVQYLPAAMAEAAPVGPLAAEAVRQIRAYLSDPDYVFDLPVVVHGTPHQLKVWRAISDIGCGQTQTYGELAARIGSGPRAVGAACGSNPVPIIVPCHRVVAAAGLGGFMHSRAAFPLDIKRWLLAHEAR